MSKTRKKVETDEILEPKCCSCGIKKGELRPTTVFTFDKKWVCSDCALADFLELHAQQAEKQFRELLSGHAWQLKEFTKELDEKDRKIAKLEKKLKKQKEGGENGS